MNGIIIFLSIHGQEIGGYCFIALIIGVFVARFISYFRIKTFTMVVGDDYIQTKGLFGVKKIFYRDIESVKFMNLTDSGEGIPSFQIYIDIFTTKKESISFFVNSLQFGDFGKLFSGIINNSDLYKNDPDFIKFAKGEYSQEDMYRLAGVLDNYNRMYNTDFSKVKDTPIMKFLWYLILAGTFIFFAIMAFIIYYF